MISEITNRAALEKTSLQQPKEARIEEKQAEKRETETEVKHAELEPKVKAEITGKGQEVDVTA